MDKKNKAEQFRRSKNNFFKKGYVIGKKSHVQLFIVMKRKGKTYTFTNTSLPLREFCASIDYDKVILKTAADLESTSREKRNENAGLSALAKLGIKVPTAPLLEKVAKFG